MIGNGWGKPDPEYDHEHYWKRRRGEDVWTSLCGVSIDPVGYLFDTLYIELYYAKKRSSINLCSTCLAAFMDDPDQAQKEVVCPDPLLG
jgi:hypothetical protein